MTPLTRKRRIQRIKKL